jgi:hypothetical protein
MGHMLHARARTTPAVRREIQGSQESLIKLAARYGVKTQKLLKNGEKEILSMMRLWGRRASAPEA